MFGLLNENDIALANSAASVPLQIASLPQPAKKQHKCNRGDQAVLQAQHGQHLQMSSLAGQINSLDAAQMTDAAAHADFYTADLDIDMEEAFDSDSDDDSHRGAEVQQALCAGHQAQDAAALQGNGLSTALGQASALHQAQPAPAFGAAQPQPTQNGSHHNTEPGSSSLTDPAVAAEKGLPPSPKAPIASTKLPTALAGAQSAASMAAVTDSASSSANFVICSRCCNIRPPH